MADHVIQQLVTAVQTRLTGLATTGARVYAQRPVEYELQESELPALRIYEEGEEIEPLLIHAPAYRRDVTLRVQAVVKAASGVSATLLAIRKEVEIALATDLTVAGRLVSLVYRGAEAMEISGQADRQVGTQNLSFGGQLETAAATPDALL